MTRWLRALVGCSFRGAKIDSPKPKWQLAIICNSSFRESSALFWPASGPMCRHEGKTSIHKIIIIKEATAVLAQTFSNLLVSESFITSRVHRPKTREGAARHLCKADRGGFPEWEESEGETTRLWLKNKVEGENWHLKQLLLTSTHGLWKACAPPDKINKIEFFFF